MKDRTMSSRVRDDFCSCSPTWPSVEGPEHRALFLKLRIGFLN